MKKVICFLMAAVLLLSAVPVSLAEDSAADGKETVVSKLTDTAVTFLHKALKPLRFKTFIWSKWRDSKCGETVSDVTYGYSWFSRNDLI